MILKCLDRDSYWLFEFFGFFLSFIKEKWKICYEELKFIFIIVKGEIDYIWGFRYKYLRILDGIWKVICGFLKIERYYRIEVSF